MRLTRAAMRNEIRTLEAQVALRGQEIDRLQADLYKAQRDPALVENVRLAHQLEQAERKIHILNALVERGQRRWERLCATHPELVPEIRGAAS